MIEIICFLDILIFYIIAKFHDFQSQILLNDFDFWQFSIAPQHVGRYGKFLNLNIFAPFGLWKSWTEKMVKPRFSFFGVFTKYCCFNAPKRPQMLQK